MKGSHQQSSLLSALTQQHLVLPNEVDAINAGFIRQSKPFIRYLVEDKKSIWTP
ncbi:MAG: type IV pilus assembly protein PilB [Alteromonadaceae bacterium]|jgi:type IV pilus assembly protein PilB|tara:strand:+ start:5373 stop:5534 length:162 start_codon:yes stop_codon:yes gene_type:complete